MGDNESTYIQKYLPTEDSKMLPAEIVFLGTYEKCLEIQGKLKDGSMTEQEAKALDDAEKLYIISDDTYLHIQRTDDGFDYSLYDKETSKLIDGGQIGSPDQHIYSACLSVCDLHGLTDIKSSTLLWSCWKLCKKHRHGIPRVFHFLTRSLPLI